VLLVAPLLLLLAAAPGARAASFVVVSSNDADDGTCNASHCSLREAIRAANASPGPDLIRFDLGTATVSPSSQLPILTDDGTTIRGDGLIRIDGSSAPLANGLQIRSSGNRIQGLEIRDFEAHGIWIQGSVGTGPADDNVIGTDGDEVEDALEGNSIYNNGFTGITIHGPSATGNVVAGNFVGVGAAGDQAQGNGLTGVNVDFDARDNRVGTDADGRSDALERNVIGANGTHGVFLGGEGFNRVAGNIIGFAANGSDPLGNQGDGVAAYFSDFNSIGPGNLIGNNGINGVAIAASRGNRVIGNRIGTDATGDLARGNAFNGVRIFAGEDTPALRNQVGFSIRIPDLATPFVVPDGNVIAHNGWHGVFIDSHSEGFLATDNAILFNSIHSNELLGIDLVSNACPVDGCSDGVTPNDAGDTDGGGNDSLNFPVILFASVSSTHTYVRADIVNGLPDTPFNLQFFANPACDASGNGEGEIYLGQVGGSTDASGNLSVFAALGVPAPAGALLTSTATQRGFGGLIPVNTSEFSACAGLVQASFENLVDVMLSLLDTYSENGQMNRGNARALAAQLESALRHAMRGRTLQAWLQLQVFQHRVGTLVRRHRVSPEVGRALLDSSEAAILALGFERPAGKPKPHPPSRR
jgi:CSLREA domain-containing protein